MAAISGILSMAWGMCFIFGHGPLGERRSQDQLPRSRVQAGTMLKSSHNVTFLYPPLIHVLGNHHAYIVIYIYR